MSKVPSILTLRAICQSKEILERENEDWYAKLIGRRISIYFTKAFIFMRLSANTISVLRLVLAFMAGFVFVNLSIPSIIAFFVLIQLSFILDSCDGELARYYKEFTKLGANLEGISPYIISIILFLSFGLQLWNVSGDSIYIFLGSTLGISELLRLIVWRTDSKKQLKTLSNNNSHDDGKLRNYLIRCYRIYSRLNLKELYHSRGRILVFLAADLVAFFFGYSFIVYMLAIFVCWGLVMLLSSLWRYAHGNFKSHTH
jgi:hypothetical protein